MTKVLLDKDFFMQDLTSEELASAAIELGLIDPAKMPGVWRELGSHDAPSEQFGSVCVRKELLTGYQWERVRQGYRNGFFYGRAKVLYQAGAGSFARVYRAIAQDSGEILAVKVLRKRFSSDEIKGELFLREGRMGLMLRHPGIVRIEEVGKEGVSSFITMEFVEGQTLRELVKIRKGLDLIRGFDLASQLIDALVYAHGEHVTHRDLKASNVLVSSKGQAKLVDFLALRVSWSPNQKKMMKLGNCVPLSTLRLRLREAFVVTMSAAMCFFLAAFVPYFFWAFTIQ